MEQHLIGQNIEANKALLERLFWHMVGIVNLVRRKTTISPGREVAWQEIGTGTACQYRGARIILTAKHVLEDAGPSDLRFLPRGSGRIEWADEPRRTRTERIALDIERIVLCEWEDLAAIVLARTCAELEYVRFCELPDKLAYPPEQGMCVVIGYPYDQSFVAEASTRENGTTHRLSAKSDGFWSEIVRTDRALADFDPDRHFLLRFYPSFLGERPDGYSGAGAWDAGGKGEEGALWSPDPLLTGVLTHVYRKSGLLKVVKSGVVGRFLDEAIPTPRGSGTGPQ